MPEVAADEAWPAPDSAPALWIAADPGAAGDELEMALRDAGLPPQRVPLLALLDPQSFGDGVVLIDTPDPSSVAPTRFLEAIALPKGLRVVGLVDQGWLDAVLALPTVHDCIARPVRVVELVGRLRWALRAPEPPPAGNDSRAALEQPRAPEALTQREEALVSLLRSDAGRVFTRDEILARVWADDFDGSARVVDTMIGRVRRKLGRRTSGCIRTVRRVGYKWIDAR